MQEKEKIPDYKVARLPKGPRPHRKANFHSKSWNQVWRVMKRKPECTKL